MLRIDKKLVDKIIVHCEADYPLEVCGVLLGKVIGNVHLVDNILPAKNLNQTRTHDRYELDPVDFLRADAQARREGLEIIGFYHSHPDHPSDASETDRERAWEGYSYLIGSVSHGTLDHFKSWRLDRGEMVEEKMEVIDG